MASPVNDAYSVGSGMSVWAGRYPSGLLSGGAVLGDVAAAGGMQSLVSGLSGEAALSDVIATGSVDGIYVPSWVTSAAVGTWGEVPFSNTLADLNPRDNPAINPNYPASPEWYAGGHLNIINGWCGACYDTDGEAWWLPLNGGHADYAGNEPYKAAINQEAPAWVMVRPPSGAIGNLLTTNDGQDATGLYADGQPRAIHSYNKPVYVPGVGPCVATQGNCSWGAQSGTSKFVTIDPETGLGTLGANDNPAAGMSSGGGSCYDPTRHAVWWRNAGTGTFSRYDVATGVWTAVGSNEAMSGYSSLCYLPDDDCLLWGNSSLGQDFAVFDCETGTYTEPTFSGSVSGGLRPGHTQWHWVPSLGACIGWDNSTDRTRITRLTPGANPRTDTWTVDYLPVDEANAVTPSTRNGNGTYGRCQYSPRLGIVMVLNSTSEAPFFFRIH